MKQILVVYSVKELGPHELKIFVVAPISLGRIRTLLFKKMLIRTGFVRCSSSSYICTTYLIEI